MSRPELINTSEFDAHDRRQRRAQARYGFVAPEDKPEDKDERHQVLCGLGAQYLAPHIHGGRIQMLDRGCFADSIASGQVVNLQMDHEGDMVIASTNTGLELDDCDLGVLFRLDLRRAKNASIVARMVDVGNRACASVAFQVQDERTEVYGGTRFE